MASRDLSQTADAATRGPTRAATSRLYNHSMLMFSDLPWARDQLAWMRRLQQSPNPNLARLYREDADALESAIQATEADLRDLEEELRHVHA